MARARNRLNVKDSPESNDSNCLSVADKSIFITQPFNEALEDANKMDIPNMLFSELVFESEITVLFASANTGKTMLAMQIGDSIAAGRTIDGFVNKSPKQPVLYIDFELSKIQLEKRYSERDENDKGYNHYRFDANFNRVTLDPNYFENHTPERIIESIKNEAEKTKSKIIFIDNITWITQTGLEKGKDAGKLMKQLVKLKRELNLTIIILAHTPKKDKYSAITLNDLAGSAVFGAFIDSAFALNYSAYDNKYRYIKQVKCRSAELKYGSNNVLPVELK